VLGLQGKYKISKKIMTYSQVMLDGFSNGLKAGFQLGGAWYHPFNFKNQVWRLEYNYVSPYSYTNTTTLQNYAHYNMPLAHPWGAGFNELVFFFNWRWDDFFFENKWIYGNFKLTDGKEYGKDIFLSSVPPPASTTSQFGQIVYCDLKLGYLINPITNLSIQIGLTNYYRFNGTQRNNSNYLYVGISTSLSNIYLDI
jgi:hypothetical protein